MADGRTERERIRAAAGAVDRVPDCGDVGPTSLLATTTTVSSYPASPGAFFACNPTLLDGTESEGSGATPTPDTSQILFAYNEGTQVPASGTLVIVHAVGGRWVFRYDG